MYNLHLPARFPLPLPKSIKQSRERMMLQRHKNIIQYNIFCARNRQKGCFRQTPPSRAGDSTTSSGPLL